MGRSLVVVDCPLAPAACKGMDCPFNGLGADPDRWILCPVMARQLQGATPDAETVRSQKEDPPVMTAGLQGKRAGQ